MATLTAKLDLSVSGITSDAISFTGLTQTKTVLAGGITSRSIDDTATAGETIVEQAHYAEGTMIYLKNRGTENVNIELSAGATEIVLGASEWAFFPFDYTQDISVKASAASQTLEYWLFDRA